MARSDYTKAGQVLERQHASSPTEIMKQRKAYFEARIPLIAKWVRGGVRPESLVRFALLDLQQNPKLQACDPSSIYMALLACAVTGCEPGALKGEAYIVPFGGRAQFMCGYRGMIKMAKRSGEVTNIFANVVHQRDTFDIDLGSDARVTHRPALSDRGDVIGVYAIAKMAHGSNEVEWLSSDDIERIRKVAESRGKSPAWSQWPEEQARKSAIKRLAKRLPLGHDYIVSVAIEQAQEEIGDAKDIIDLETDGAASQVESAPQIQIDEPAFDPSTDIPS